MKDKEKKGTRSELEELDIYEGKPHREDVYTIIVYCNADTEKLIPKVQKIQERFEDYEDHIRTSVYEDLENKKNAVASIWKKQNESEKIIRDLSELPGIIKQPKSKPESGFGTIGMFYEVKSEYREKFLDTFNNINEILGKKDGHKETTLFVNTSNKNDMFIFSKWRSKKDAMKFFQSKKFSETVSLGRELLEKKPKHVFLS